MGQPKKLTHKQRKQRDIDVKLTPVRTQAKALEKRLLRPGGSSLFTIHQCRSDALELFRYVSNSFEFPQDNSNVQDHVKMCLNVAREAQCAINFMT